MAKQVSTIVNKYAFLFFWLLVSIGCSTRLPVVGVAAFDACDYGKAMGVFEEQATKSGKDHVLYNLALLSAALRAQDYGKAEQASLRAQRVMWSDAGKERGVTSLVSAEAIKIFKGEPFEKAMASIYSGVIYFNRGEYDTARASFLKAGLAINQKEENHQDDLALAHWLQAKVFLQLGETDNARVALTKAEKACTQSPEMGLSRLASGNTIVLVELGRIAEKIRTGPGKSLTDWKRHVYPEFSASLFVDDQEIGKASELADLTYQAKTKGRTGKDTIQGVKGVTREAAAVTAVIAAGEASKGNKTAGWVALGAGLFAVTNQSQADIRQWELLPDRILAISTTLPVGKHRMRVVFYDSRRAALSGYDQVWYYDRKSPQEEIIFLVASRPCPGNVDSKKL